VFLFDIHSLNEHVQVLNQHVEKVGKYTFTFYCVRSFLNDPAGTIINAVRHTLTTLCWWFIIGSIIILVVTWGMLGWVGVETLLGHRDAVQKFLHK